MTPEVLYAVTWRDTSFGPPHILDGYDKDEMHDVAIRLAEQGKDVEPLIGPILVDMTPEAIAAMEDVRAKLFARLASDRVVENLALRQKHLDDCATCHKLFESPPVEEAIG